MYVRVGTEEQLVNDRAEKQVVVDSLKIVSAHSRDFSRELAET